MPPGEPIEEDGLRKVGPTLLALPVLAWIYVSALARRRVVRAAGIGVAAVAVALLVVAWRSPAPSIARPAAVAPAPVDGRVLEALATGHGLRDPIRIEFDAPMDPAAVAEAMQLAPDTAVTFGWDATGRVLTIRPVAAWRPDTLHVLTVSVAARAADGGTLSAPVRAVVLTAKAGSGIVEATRRTGSRARVDTAFRVILDRAVPLAAVRDALVTRPHIDGTVAEGRLDGEFLFTPAAPLMPGTEYRLTVRRLVDGDGVRFATDPELGITTADAPRVVRFRPARGASRVERASTISVRFTQRMDRDATAPAFRVTVGGDPVAGEVSWAESGTVLVFVPDRPFAYGAKVEARVGGTAVSRAGTPIAEVADATFTVEPKPAPKPKPAAPSRSGDSSRPTGKSGGGGAASGGWAGVESYYLRLMNCTRTGGWVTSTGKCSSPGGRDVRPLVMNAGISAKVARPYAKLLATRNVCSHFVGGNPGDRLRRAGYTSYRWAENLGCRSGNPYGAVLGSHRYFQSEKPYNGGHYRNLMDARYRQVGIGVWVASGRVRLVVDFYTP